MTQNYHYIYEIIGPQLEPVSFSNHHLTQIIYSTKSNVNMLNKCEKITGDHYLTIRSQN